MSSKKILFATDYSEASQHALQYAAWLTQCARGRLLIVHVSEHEQYPVGEHFNEEPEPNPQEIDQLESVVPKGTTIPYEHRLLYGEPGSVETTKPAKVIVDFAKDENVEMIVLGTHGRSGFRRVLMGSIAESVMRHADCPVVTIRQSMNSQNTSPE